MTAPVAEPPTTATPTAVGWLSERSFWLHAAALAVLLIALLPALDNGSVGFTDEGIYSSQVLNLSNGSWAAPLPSQDVDPDGERVAATGSTVVDGEYIPYARHPLYPLALLPFHGLAGQGGMLLLSCLGTLLAAITAGRLAARFGPGLPVPTLWLVGVGSPLLFDAYLVVAHSLAAGLSGLLALCAFRAAFERRTAASVLGAFVGAVGLVLLRSEGVLLAVALGAAVCLMGIQLRPRFAVQYSRVAVGVAVAGSAALAFMFDARWANAITGVAGSSSGEIDRTIDPASAAWVSLLRPWHGDARAARVETILMVLSVLGAAASARLLPRLQVLSLSLLVLAASCAAVIALSTPALISGLVPAFPVLILGLAMLGVDDLRRPMAQLLLGTSAATSALIVATSYDVGGATEWGGRFFHVVIPLLGPAVALGLSRIVRLYNGIQRMIALGAIVVLTASLSIAALRINADYRTAAYEIVRTTVAAVDRSESEPVVIVAPLAASGSSRIFWQELHSGTDVLSTAGAGDLHEALERLAAADRDQALILTDVDSELLSLVLGDTLTELGWQAGPTTPIPHGAFNLIEVGAGV